MGNRFVVFIFLDENICCGYSLEAPRRGASNEYPQHMFLSRNKKNIDTFWLKKSALSRAMDKYLSLFVPYLLFLRCLAKSVPCDWVKYKSKRLPLETKSTLQIKNK